MFKRTRGYVVLTLLIVTGLASQVYSPTISSSERHFVITKLKDSRKSFISATAGLSQAQLNFKPGGEKSIKQYCAQLEAFNKEIWTHAEASLQTPAEEHCSNMSAQTCDYGIKAGHQSCCKKACNHPNTSTTSTWPRSGNITDCIKLSQTNLIRYARTTTEDLHGHILETNKGKMDIYQALLAISTNTNNVVAEINKIRANAHFPHH
jgi:hypothetical protein